MNRLGTQRNKVPKHVGVRQVRRGIALLRVNKGGKEHGVPEKENWRVVPNQIPVSFLGIEFNGEAFRIYKKRSVRMTTQIKETLTQ